jgi:DNA-binding IscR family transcriptional regulator
MKTETASDTILDLIKKGRVVSTDRIAKELDINKSAAAGLLSQMKKCKVIVGRNGLWAKNHTDLNLADSILTNQQTTVSELISIMNSIVSIGKKS